MAVPPWEKKWMFKRTKQAAGAGSLTFLAELVRVLVRPNSFRLYFRMKPTTPLPVIRPPKNCRILYLVGQLRPGGLERQLYYVLQTIDRERYRPAVAVWDFREEDVYVPQLRSLGVPIYSFPSALSGTTKLQQFRRLVGEVKPEVVHSCSFYTNFAAHWSVRGTEAVALGAVRSDFIRAKKEAGPWLGRLSARWPRTQISNSFSAADVARHSRGLFVPARLIVSRNGLDLERFRYAPLSATNPARIVGVGSLLPIKRWDRLLRAASQLKRSGYDCLIRIAGDGPLHGSLQQQAQELGLANRVELAGYGDDIPGLLSNATFLVHTSDSEGCPNVVMEAMACGRAVVATDAGDVPSLVDDGKTGFVVRRGDDAALVDRMVTLLNDRELCRSMGEAGRAKAERDFGLDRLVSETLAAYQAAGWKDD